MAVNKLAAVTGAFSYSGSYIAQALMDKGWETLTLTRRPERAHPLQGKVQAFPLDFEDRGALTRNLEGVDCLVNTYWVRFKHPGSDFEQAVRNISFLVEAAREAGVRRVVHLSVSNPNVHSPLPYYSGKARAEEVVRSSGLSYAILQPTLIFGKEEVLVNNIAWLLRHSPFFAIPGDGSYRLQPIYVEDLAKSAAQAADQDKNEVISLAGPEVLTFEELVRFLAEVVDSRAKIFHAPPAIALMLARLLGLAMRDVLLTRDELQGLMDELLYVGDDIYGTTSFKVWARRHVGDLGRRYSNEIKRHHHYFN